MINGNTLLIAHIGYPTHTFKSPLIYNPWFDAAGIDAMVMPMSVKAEDFPAVLKPLFRLTNIRGALSSSGSAPPRRSSCARWRRYRTELETT